MGSLMLEVLTKSDHLPVARAQVSGISSLSVLHPISGFYTLLSPTSEKLGELQVSKYIGYIFTFAFNTFNPRILATHQINY